MITHLSTETGENRNIFAIYEIEKKEGTCKIALWFKNGRYYKTDMLEYTNDFDIEEELKFIMNTSMSEIIKVKIGEITLH